MRLLSRESGERERTRILVHVDVLEGNRRRSNGSSRDGTDLFRKGKTVRREPNSTQAIR